MRIYAHGRRLAIWQRSSRLERDPRGDDSLPPGLVLADPSPAPSARPDGFDAAVAKTTAELVAKHGETVRARAERGVRQVATLWRTEDGDAAQFADFVRRHFAPDAVARD